MQYMDRDQCGLQIANNGSLEKNDAFSRGEGDEFLGFWGVNGYVGTVMP
jgi:hypothetical protein